MARDAYGSRTTCESCRSIDVRRWHREGWLERGQIFSSTWSRDGEPTGSISVRSELDAVILSYRARTSWAVEWEPIEQRVPITWTDCHFGGRRPWFVCTICRRRVAVLYAAGELFACRSCYGLAYESQQQDPPDRSLLKAQKIRMRLGGSGCPADLFPDKPKGMHWRTYDRMCEDHDFAQACSLMHSMRLADRFRDDEAGLRLTERHEQGDRAGA